MDQGKEMLIWKSYEYLFLVPTNFCAGANVFNRCTNFCKCIDILVKLQQVKRTKISTISFFSGEYVYKLNLIFIIYMRHDNLQTL